MSALNNLAAFVYKLPEELQTEFMNLVDAVTDERDRLQNERLATLQATTGNYEVVAIAGTAEQLLSDVINVGDTVELNPNVKPAEEDMEYLIEDADVMKPPCIVTAKETFSDGINIKINYDSYWYEAELFRKVTPSTNPTKPEQLC